VTARRTPSDHHNALYSVRRLGTDLLQRNVPHREADGVCQFGQEGPLEGHPLRRVEHELPVVVLKDNEYKHPSQQSWRHDTKVKQQRTWKALGIMSSGRKLP
jgi:hypothetical protein